MSAGVADGTYALIVVSAIATIWATTIIWYVITWQRHRRHERERRRTRAMRSLANRRTDRH